MSNLLLRGDKGFTFPQVFDILSQADLRLASMLEWNAWELENLFTDHNAMDEDVVKRLEEMSLEDSLTLVQLLDGQKRLLDFWAVRKADEMPVHLAGLTSPECQGLQLLLHPVVSLSPLWEALLEGVQMHRCVTLNTFWPVPLSTQVVFDPSTSALILSLADGQETVGAFVQRFVTLTSQIRGSSERGAEMAADLLHSLENIGMVLIERREGLVASSVKLP